MISLTEIDSESSDATYSYKVALDDQYTVEEFVDWVLSRGDRGNIIIVDPDFNKNLPIPTDFHSIVGDRIVDSVDASGGYGCMDFRIILKSKKVICDRNAEVNHEPWYEVVYNDGYCLQKLDFNKRCNLVSYDNDKYCIFFHGEIDSSGKIDKHNLALIPHSRII